jgi:homoserine trans-succinylase
MDTRFELPRCKFLRNRVSDLATRSSDSVHVTVFVCWPRQTTRSCMYAIGKTQWSWNLRR